MKNRKRIALLILTIVILLGLLFLTVKSFQPEPTIPEKLYVLPTSTPVPTETQIPTPTNTPEPEPTPTNTPEPTPIATEIPEPTPVPTTNLQVVDSGKGMSLASLKIIGMFNDLKETKIEVLLFLISVFVGLLCYQVKKMFFTKKGETKN
jgi:hypothetical protein